MESRIVLSGCNEVQLCNARIDASATGSGSVPRRHIDTEHTATDHKGMESRIVLSGCNQVQLCNARIDASAAGSGSVPLCHVDTERAATVQRYGLAKSFSAAATKCRVLQGED